MGYSAQKPQPETQTADIQLPNESGTSDLYLDTSRRKNGPLRPLVANATDKEELTDKGTIFRGPTYRTQKKRPVTSSASMTKGGR